MAQKRISTEKLQDSATRDTCDQKKVAVRYELQLRPYQLAWLKEELEYFKEWIEFCLYSNSEDAVKWRIDNSGIAKDESIKEYITETEYILEEIHRSFSVQNYWKAIRLSASQLEWLQYYFLYFNQLHTVDTRKKDEKQQGTTWKCDCAMIDHLLKNIESLNAISMISYCFPATYWGKGK